jgi:hypothetical protein
VAASRRKRQKSILGGYEMIKKSIQKKGYKSNSAYANPIGIRPYDKLEREKYPLLDEIYKYDRDRYKGINEFADALRMDSIEYYYQDFCRKRGPGSIKDFFKATTEKDFMGYTGSFDEILFTLHSEQIIFLWKHQKEIAYIFGIFRIGDYIFFKTNNLMFLQHRRSGKSYIYQGVLV